MVTVRLSPLKDPKISEFTASRIKIRAISHTMFSNWFVLI